jgi:GGDEF domain-containing protein
MRKFLSLLISLTLLSTPIAWSKASVDIAKCAEKKAATEARIVHLCNNVDDIICKDVKKEERRSCNDGQRSLVDKYMSPSDVSSFVMGCFKASVTAFANFFTEFIPEVLGAIWKLTKGAAELTANSFSSKEDEVGWWGKMKGIYETSRSIAVDVYEAVRQNPAEFIVNLWDKMVEAVGPVVQSFECLNPQTKVEKVCGFVAGWMVPPALFAKLLVKGAKFAKESLKAGEVVINLAEKSRLQKLLDMAEKRPHLSIKEYQEIFDKYKTLGYTDEEFDFLYKSGALAKIKIEDLKPLATAAGKKQREDLLSEFLQSKKAVENRNVHSTPAHIGQVVETITPHQFPSSMRLRKYKNEAGEEFVMYEKVVTDAEGKVVVQSRELPLDPLTGAFDANYPAGKLLLEDLIKEKQGKATFAFIDVNNLGYVNNNFLKGRHAGDAYLASIAKAIADATEGKAQLFKLGGDEYGVVIHETDPIKAQAILQKIIDSSYSKEVHQGFRENTIARVAAVRAGRTIGADGKVLPLDAETIKAIKEYSPYSREGISIGAAAVKVGDSYERILKAAEAQAVKQKIGTKEALNISAKKYGGADAVPGAKPNLKFVPKAEVPAIAEAEAEAEAEAAAAAQAAIPAAKTTDIALVKTYGADKVLGEKYRFGELAIVEHKMPDGSIILKYNRYFTAENGTRHYVTRELVQNSKVGFIDSTHESGKYVLERLADGKNAVEHSRGFVWINAENLGKINYFHEGTAKGDQLLAITAQVIKKELSASGIPVKMAGSEFAILQDGISQKEVSGMVARIHEALINNPEIKKIYSDQLTYLQGELARVEALPANAENSKKLADIRENLEMVAHLKPQYSVEGHMLTEQDNLASALGSTRGLHYK